MSAQRKDLELEDERTAQKQYAKLLHEKATRQSVYHGPRNGLWTGTGLPTKRTIAAGELVGRVALSRPDEDILDGGSDFYIGETYAYVNGINVFGWTTPIACTFFRGDDHHDLCDDVAVVRAFRRDNGQIVDYVDEKLRDDAPAAPFEKRGLNIPAPPSRPKPPLPSPSPHARQELEPTPTSENASKNKESVKSNESPPASRPGGRGVTPAELPPLRAEELLRAQMLAPRTKSLEPVLSTLQSDQYAFVTLPAMDSVIIEGQPGTGKTIVASHRAAYLVNEETPPENALDGDVLIVGPTAGYSKHIREVVSRLAGPTERIKILSLPELTNHILGLKQRPRAHSSRTWQDVGWELVKFARSAIRKLKDANGVTPLPEQVYEYLRLNATKVTPDREWSSYLRQLPSRKEALTDTVHAPLLAFIQWEIAKPADLTNVEHVIVDEAQDVTPLEWLLLDEINEADAWTILGDLNQRRSDHTLASWSQVLDVIAIDPETPIRRIKRGYRSTKPILEFANRLLPRDQRKVHAFQESGPEPTFQKAHPKELADIAVREIKRLITAYRTGTVAAISTSPGVITGALRLRGWASSAHDPQLWSKDGLEVTVAVPDDARGLEFDAVVVVEPIEFPENFGRQGPLYTALTRANRELAVVHAQALPDGLRRR